MEVKDALKRFRAEQHLTQKQVAEKIGITYQSYQVYEANSIPTATVIIKIAQAFGVSADYLLGLSDEPTPKKYNDDEVKDAFALRDSLRKVLATI